MAYDVAYLGDPGIASDTPTEMVMGPDVVDGAYALAQKVLALLFTEEDSAYSFGFGATLPSEVTGSNNYDEGELKGRFDIAAAKISENIRLTTPTDAPLDSQLERIEILVKERAEQNPDEGDVTVIVYTRAGTSVSVDAPMPLNQVRQNG